MSKIIRIGSSLGFIIPKGIVMNHKIKKGSEVNTIILKNGVMLDIDSGNKLTGDEFEKLLYRIGLDDNPPIYLCKCGRSYTKTDKMDHTCYVVEFTTQMDAYLARLLLKEAKKDV